MVGVKNFYIAVKRETIMTTNQCGCCNKVIDAALLEAVPVDHDDAMWEAVVFWGPTFRILGKYEPILWLCRTCLGG